MAGITGSSGGWRRTRSGEVVTVHEGDLVIVRGGGGFIVQDSSVVPVDIINVDSNNALVKINGELKLYGEFLTTGQANFNGEVHIGDTLSLVDIGHSDLLSPIPFSETGESSLHSGFTAISVIGAINELMRCCKSMKVSDLWNFVPPPQSPSDGTEVWFSSYFPYSNNRVMVFVDGTLQYFPSYNQHSAGNGVTFTSPVYNGADLLLFYSDVSVVNEWVFETSINSPSDGVNTIFATSSRFASEKIAVFVGNTFQPPSTYVEDTNGMFVNFTDPIPADLTVRFFYFKFGYGDNWIFEEAVEGQGDGIRNRFSTSSPFKEGKILAFIGCLQQDEFDYFGASSWVEFPGPPFSGATVFFIYIKN